MHPCTREVLSRSNGRCEAWLEFSDGTRERCGAVATDIHHLLTKARGGTSLDKVGEIYHLIHLCRHCHMACDGKDAYEGGMLIQGSVIWDKLHDRPVYTGPDPYLKKKYG